LPANSDSRVLITDSSSFTLS